MKNTVARDEFEERGEENPYSVITKNTVNVHTSILRSTARLIDPNDLRKVLKAIQHASVVHALGFGSSAAPAMYCAQPVNKAFVRF